MTEILIDDGQGQAYDILAIEDNAQIGLLEDDNSVLDNSANSEAPEKQDSGIEDKDSHPNSPATTKYESSQAIVQDEVREKIVKSILEKKLLQEEKRPKKSISKSYEKRKPNNKRPKKHSLPNTANNSYINKHNTTRSRSGNISKGAPGDQTNHPIKNSRTRIFKSAKTTAATSQTKKLSPVKVNQSLIRTLSTSPKVNRKGVLLCRTHPKGGDKKLPFENLKVISRKTKKGWNREVESPTLQRKRDASKELLNLIKGTQQTSSAKDKENASKHLLAIIQGTHSRNAKPLSVLRPANRPTMIPSSVLPNVSSILTKISETHRENIGFPKSDSLELLQKETDDDDFVEEDSHATTVKSCILKTDDIREQLSQVQIQ